jgi:acetyl-CoA carboxylase biotin carboxyl carrier protein
VPFTADEVRQILEAIERSEWEEVRLVSDDLTLVVSKSGAPTLPPVPTGTEGDGTAGPAAVMTPAAAPLPAPAAAPPVHREPIEVLDGAHAATPAPPATTEHHETVTVGAPSLGLFWRSPKPGAPPFIDVGDTVDAGSTVCIVEVMKLMNHVKAGCAGVVTAIHADDGQMVEHGQPLVSIAPPTS